MLRTGGFSGAIALALALVFCAEATASLLIRRPLEANVYAIARDARTIGIEVHPGRGHGARLLLSKYLAIESEWVAYQGRLSSFIPLSRLKETARRDVLLAVYSNDAIDASGWWHEAVYDGETLWTLCTWVTGDGQDFKRVTAHRQNRGVQTTLKAGDRVLIPATLLRGQMAKTTRERVREEVPELVELRDGLKYGRDRKGPYAVYTLKRGETLYSSVVARFTDIRENDPILEACRTIAKRSGIADVTDIDSGSRVLIPTELLADRYLQRGNPERDRYEATLKEAKRLRVNPVRSRDLSDVVVILDPGHGGDDTGAKHAPTGLYEDEINYDIVSRIRALLEKETGARVYVTVNDRSSGRSVTDAHRFRHDKDEELLTNPRHPNSDGSSVSANLRWMLVNSIYDREVARGVDKRKIVFTSIHTDSLYNYRLRGAMIYIPGAQYRRAEEVRHDKLYAKYQEGRSFNRFTSSSSERTRDEALSRNFAETILEELGRKRVKRHDQGDPIRSKIRRSRTNVFVPAVLRNTKVPTKVLVETANLKNATDRQRLADPWWRQQFARAYVDALKRYYGSDLPTRVAMGD